MPENPFPGQQEFGSAAPLLPPGNVSPAVPGASGADDTPAPSGKQFGVPAILLPPAQVKTKASLDSGPFGSPAPELPEQTFGVPAALLPEGTKAQPSTTEESKSLWQRIKSYNKPLTESLLGLPESWSRKGAGPVETGVEKAVTGFATGITSPSNLALMAVTGGLGGLAEGAGGEVLSSLSPEAAAMIPRAAKVIGQLAGYGFSGQQLYGAIHSVAPLRVAIRNGDVEQATRIITQTLLGSTIAGLSAAHQLRQGTTVFGNARKPLWGPDKEAIGSFQREVETHNIRARNFESENAELLKDKPLDMAARLYHEAGGDAATLDRWRDEIAASPKVKPDVRAKYAGLLELAKRLPQDHPQVAALSQKLRDDYATDWETAKGAHKIDPSKPGAVNYAGQHTYDPANEADSNIRPQNGRQLTKSPAFLKKRTFENIPDAIKAGFVPKNVGLVRARADYIRKFGESRGVIEAENSIMNQTASDGRPVAVGPNQVRNLGGKRVLYLGSEKAAEAPPVTFKRVTGAEPSDKSYVYHATNEENARQIAVSELAPHPPDYGTDQEAWPDGSTAKRAYFTPTAENPWQFAPEGGKPVLLRVARNAARFQKESTGDIFTNKAILPENIQYLGADNQWHSLVGVNDEPAPAESVDVAKFDPSDILRKDGKVYLDLSDYQQAKPPFERYKFIANDEDGSPIFEKKPDLIHPGYADSINKAFDQNSWFRQTPVISNLLKTSARAKQMLLSLSPFHFTTEYLRGLQMGLNPGEAFSPPALSEDRPAVHIGTKYGLVLMGDSAARTMTAEGEAANSSLLSKLPGVGPMLDSVQDHLFGNWIPRLKAQVWESLDRQLMRRHPDMAPEQVHAMAAHITNAAFGGLNWRQLGWSLGSQDFLRLVMLAPDFSGSQLAFAKQGLEPGTGSPVRRSLMRIAAYNFLVAQSLNLLLTGKVQPEHPFSVQDPQNPHKAVSIRTMPADIWHGLTDPRGFAMNRLNPLTTRSGLELLTQRNIEGRKVDARQELTDLFRNVFPISLQQLVPQFRYAEQTPAEGVMHGLGLSVMPDESPAYQLAAKLASGRGPDQAMDPAKLAHYEYLSQLEQALHAGTLEPSAVEKLVQSGRLSYREASSVRAAVRETRGRFRTRRRRGLCSRSSACRWPMHFRFGVWPTIKSGQPSRPRCSGSASAIGSPHSKACPPASASGIPFSKGSPARLSDRKRICGFDDTPLIL